MMRHYELVCLLIEFSPQRSFCLQALNEIPPEIQVDSLYIPIFIRSPDFFPIDYKYMLKTCIASVSLSFINYSLVKVIIILLLFLPILLIHTLYKLLLFLLMNLDLHNLPLIYFNQSKNHSLILMLINV